MRCFVRDCENEATTIRSAVRPVMGSVEVRLCQPCAAEIDAGAKPEIEPRFFEGGPDGPSS